MSIQQNAKYYYGILLKLNNKNSTLHCFNLYNYRFTWKKILTGDISCLRQM